MIIALPSHIALIVVVGLLFGGFTALLMYLNRKDNKVRCDRAIASYCADIASAKRRAHAEHVLKLIDFNERKLERYKNSIRNKR